MKIYQIIFQDEYNNLYDLGFYKNLDDALEDINGEIGINGFELKPGDLKEYAGTFSSVFDLDLANLTEDEDFQEELYGKMIRGFIYDSESVVEEIKKLEGQEKMEIKCMLEEGAIAPNRAHDADAGFDLFTPVDVKVPAHGSAVIDTKTHFAIPKGYVGFLKSKSGLNVKFDLVGTGVIDSGYTGPVVVKLYNNGDKEYNFEAGNKLIQIVFLPIPDVTLNMVDSLGNTERGDGGFGSTGK